ncbi:MAG: hypothetical protein RL662_2502 [Bacteroidota bacterium]|jgi:hypothetical protein
MPSVLIMIIGVFANLVAGNSVLFFGTSDIQSVNYDLMAGMSMACIYCYLFVFKNLCLKTKSLPYLLLISVLTCFAIVWLGCIIASVFTAIRLEDQFLLGVFKGIATGFFLGIVGNLGMIGITVPLGLLNVFWFKIYRDRLLSDDI